ncbi:hypothetical protein G6F50_015762 [Rhizopus delemar]|uniref:Uncharacterized protein n=1 Tax=Rhizopus delemar TaxID=936053 RepID=A0A9P7C358_9FUNG|nr:hypothetical protein G6F50_015762 [Rhizopus delemar]
MSRGTTWAAPTRPARRRWRSPRSPAAPHAGRRRPNRAAASSSSSNASSSNVGWRHERRSPVPGGPALGRQRGDRPALGPGAAHRPPPCRTPAGQRRSRRPDPGRHDGPDRGLAQLRRRPGRLVRDLRLDPHPRLDDR